MSIVELKKIIVNGNLTEKHKRIFLAVADAITDAEAGATELPEIPEEGTYTLKAVDGELTWVEDVVE